jgi:rod shape determining protein RodA
VAIDRRLVHNIDWGLLLTSLLVAAIGVATIRSATYTGANKGLEVKQVYWVLGGLVVLLVCVSLDYRRLADRAFLLYALATGLLVYVLIFAPHRAGTRRWLVLGSFQLQPSEFAKLAAALFVAKVFSESRKEQLGLGDIFWPGAAVGLMALLIAAEPDLGTAFTLVPLFVTVAFLAGLRVKAILGMGLALVVAGGLGWTFALKDYQKARIYSFIDPTQDPRGAGYQKIQSEIAVGSGGLAGKGYKQGSQSQLGYLPARWTDFIFSVLAEENGFIGVVVLLGLYMFILWRAMETAEVARDRVGALLAAGLAAVLAFQVVYNVAMVAGLVPVKGLPLPLMSYGGSSVLSSMAALPQETHPPVCAFPCRRSAGPRPNGPDTPSRVGRERADPAGRTRRCGPSCHTATGRSGRARGRPPGRDLPCPKI